MKILIVDDKPENLYLLEKVLKGGGHSAVSAKNSADALEKLKTTPVDMIISDILMPVMDGYQFCIKVRNNKALQNLPFILLTASYTEKKDEELALKIGADRFIVKPIESDILLKIIEDVAKEEKKRIGPKKPPVPEKEEAVYKLYSERLVNKLEQQILKLEQEEARLKNAQDLGQIGDWEFDILSNNITWSDEMFKLYGRDPVLGPPSPEEEAGYYQPEQAKMLREYAAKALKEGRSFECDLEANIPKRGKVNFHTIINPIRDEKGKVCKLAGTVQDITARKKMEEENILSGLKFKAVFDGANDGILIADPGTKTFVDGNKSISLLLGYSIDEIKKMGIMDIHPKEDIPYIINQFEKQSRGEITVSENLPIKLKDGSIRYVDVNANAINVGGKTYTMGLFRDVTKRRLMETNIKKRMKELEIYYKSAMDREDKILELKKEIEKLKKGLK